MIIQNQARVDLPVRGPLYLPFYNIWHQNLYWQEKAFRLNPFSLRAQSTSGSPVVLGQDTFVGFLNESDGWFAYDGKDKLTVELADGARLYYEEHCDPWAAWGRYNQAVLGKDFREDDRYFWKQVEYCTWVEQKYQAARQFQDPERAFQYSGRVLNADFVYDYLTRLDKMGFPKGKFTIDAGWHVGDDPHTGKRAYGDWIIDETKFPDLGKLIKAIAAAGHVPGLWFAPCFITADSALGRAHPDWIGQRFTGTSETPTEEEHNFLVPTPELQAHYVRLFQPFVAMGVRKFKLDMYYNDKNLMKALLQANYQACKQLDETIEVEIHIPDIFVARFGDTIRTNDVLIRPQFNWRALTAEHYRVSRYSSPHKVINLDHVGGNFQDVGEAEFMEHWHMLKAYDGYPVVSLLPDHFSPACTARFVDEIKQKAAAGNKPI